MESKDIMAEVHRLRSPEHHFIKWWRREHDFLNFELIDRFEERLGNEAGVKWLEGFSLMDTEAMWKEISHRFPDRVRRERRRAGEVIVWERPGKEEKVCPFTPENIMTVFDVETRGTVID